MPFEANWFVDGKVVFDRVVGDIDAQMIAEHDQVISAFLNAADSPKMHMIVDFSKVGTLPSVSAFTDIHWTKDDRLGWVVVYGVDSAVVKFISTVVLQMTSVSHKFVDTKEDAIGFLASINALTAPAQLPPAAAM